MTTNRKPNFLIIGAAKCATTWLQSSLSRNQTVYMPAPELHYFSWYKTETLDWYLQQFEAPSAARFIGEKSNSYLTDPEAAELILKTLPGVKLIAQLRDPVERAYSDYCMLLRRGEVSRDINVYLNTSEAEQERFIDHSRYGHHLQRFYDLFPAEDLLVLDFADVADKPAEVLGRVARHLGIAERLEPPIESRVKDKRTKTVPAPVRRLLSPFRPVLDPIRHTAPIRVIRASIAKQVNYPHLTDSIRNELTDYFQKDAEILSHLTGHTFTWTGA